MHQDSVEQPASPAGPVADQRGHRHPPTPTGHRNLRGTPASSPGARLRRPLVVRLVVTARGLAEVEHRWLPDVGAADVDPDAVRSDAGEAGHGQVVDVLAARLPVVLAGVLGLDALGL